ncbi:inactive glucose-6-phosphate 1-dehydrogenase 4, chloroplastic-like [Cornus florida]|uniref:inactive glucose-6-phosphate 1-dehydrogenase 4, chloroplastic-like n=1 Tax=Cornus florida TaxID=4283 RepID=UPI002898196F|nr:inactive glucose-6-phosphate 1-dehydrogenase 4, chloroplastic-like [Cornus florida]
MFHLPNDTDSNEGPKKTALQPGESSLLNFQPDVSTGVATSIESPSSFPRTEEVMQTSSQTELSSVPNSKPGISTRGVAAMEFPPSPQTHSFNNDDKGARPPSLCIAVIGATGELARSKIFPALFALYYSGFLPENVGIFGYSRKNLKDEDLRSMIASTLTCRIDHQQNCEDKLDAFLSRTYYLNGGHDNMEGMSKLHTRMEQIEGQSEANRIFYLSVPQEALLDVASSLGDNAQTQKGWNRVIIKKPFRFHSRSSILFLRRVEIRIQFHHVPGSIYRDRIGHNIDLATNELILRDVPNEAILLKVNNKIPGLGLVLDASELNLLYKDKYNVEVPDSYEQLLLDVIDGDNHLFMRSDEVTAAWNILSPVLDEIDKSNIAPELYELGGRGPVEAFYLWAKHGVRWVED